MKYSIPTVVFTLFICCSGCKGKTDAIANTIPVSDLAHIDVIMDSVTWNAIRTDSFIQNEFAVVNPDTAEYGGKSSFDLYLLGQLNFLHLSLAKDFWDHQQGGGVLVFQTQKAGQKDSLLKAWKQLFKDSLSLHTYKGSDFTLDEIMAWYKRDSLKPKEPVMFANLTTYSEDAYRNWGITDSMVQAGLTMQQFMYDWGGAPLKDRLFHSITELYMTISPREFMEIRSALLASGYIEKDNVFSHRFNPPVHITVTEEKGKPKYSKVKLSLSRVVPEKEFIFSTNTTLKLNGKEAWFLFN